MVHSEWICKICGEGFQTRGRRDGHQQRAHRQSGSIGIDKRDIERSENDKFKCECGRDYISMQSLQHHRRCCNIVKRRENREMEDDAMNDDAVNDDDEEGMNSIDRMELIV
jgi:hypothetical protein